MYLAVEPGRLIKGPENRGCTAVENQIQSKHRTWWSKFTDNLKESMPMEWVNNRKFGVVKKMFKQSIKK